MNSTVSCSNYKRAYQAALSCFAAANRLDKAHGCN